MDDSGGREIKPSFGSAAFHSRDIYLRKGAFRWDIDDIIKNVELDSIGFSFLFLNTLTVTVSIGNV